MRQENAKWSSRCSVFFRYVRKQIFLLMIRLALIILDYLNDVVFQSITIFVRFFSFKVYKKNMCNSTIIAAYIYIYTVYSGLEPITDGNIFL